MPEHKDPKDPVKFDYEKAGKELLSGDAKAALSSTLVAAGAILGPIGAAVGAAVAASLYVFGVKLPTQHLDYNDALPIAEPISWKTVKELQMSMPADIFARFATTYADVAGNFILSSSWWGHDQSSKKIYGNAALESKTNLDPAGRLQGALANVMIWAITASPADRADLQKSNMDEILRDIFGRVQTKLAGEKVIVPSLDQDGRPSNSSLNLGSFALLIIGGIIAVIVKVSK